MLVIGAGAAGLMAAIAAGERGARVRLLDSQTKIGAKILVAGGGRCNVTNELVDASRFHTADSDRGPRSFVARVLRSFSVEDTHHFFNRIEVPLKLEETGKYFPVSDSARTVLNALLRAVHEAGVELITGCAVTGLDEHNGQWTVRTMQGPHLARCVVLCTGGLALPKSGSNGAGYGFATRLGHTLLPTTPALTPLLAGPVAHAELSGVTLPVELSLRAGRSSGPRSSRPPNGPGAAVLARYDGSFLFTHIGYSGPAALNLSRHVVRERWEDPAAGVYLRLLPQVAEGEEARFWHELVRRGPKKTVLNALAELLPRRVVAVVVGHAGAPPEAPLGRLTAAQSSGVRRALFDCPLPVRAVADYVKAEATAGGVALPELEPATMMSRLRPGLFLAGEICDVDGWLGGYNFQWAWSSGTVAGRAAARYAARLG